MSNERTEQLIVELASAMTPVRPLPTLAARFGWWLALAAATATAAVWIIGARADLLAALARPAVQWSLLLALLTAVTGALASLRLSVPGLDRTPRARWLPIGAAAVWTGTLLLASATGDTGDAVHIGCVCRVIAISAIPAVLLWRNVRSGFALDQAWAFALAMFGGSAVGALAVQLICPIDHAAHILVSHVVPAITLTIAGTLAAMTTSSSTS